MATDTRVANLIINKGLTKSELNEKYQQGLIGDNELSVVDTEETVFQVDEMPTASAANVDSIVQYAGATTEDYTQGYFYKNVPEYSDPTVTASQTSGSDLSDITVDKDVYIEVMQPEEGDSVDFVADVMDDYVTPNGFEMGGEQFVLEMSTFLSYCKLNVYSGDWSTDVANVSINYDADNDMWTITAMDAGYNTLGSAGGMIPQSAGIMYNTLPSTGNYTVNLVYTPQRLAWRVDGAIIAYGDLSGVGISYTGTPVIGDTITATYIGRTISGYNWNQINVQPGGGGGDTSIDWKTAVDLPSTYSGGMWYCAPAFVVSGGLPDGTYEMYYQVKTRSNTFGRSAPAGVATFKIVVKLYYENDWPTMMGTIAPVINGEWGPSNNYAIAARSVYNVFHIDQNNNFVVDGKNYIPFISDLGDYGNMYVPDCFRLSSIKNIDTGDEYIATGTAPDGNFPHYVKDYAGTLVMSNLQQQQDIPVYYLSAVLSFSDSDQWINTGGFIPTPGRTASCAEFSVSLESSNGGKWHIISENTYDSYRITVLDASGDLANAQIGYDYNGNIFLYLNTPSGSSGTIDMTMSVKGGSQSVWYNWASQPSGFTPFALSTVGADITPNNYGAVLQYTGTTNANYTNGYFYKANGTPTTVQASIDCNEISSYGNTITCDVDRLISQIAAYTGWDIEYTKQRFGGVSEWQAVQQTGYLYWNQWGSFGENPSMLSCFSFTGGTQTESDTIQWVTANYLPTHTVITNSSWDRVDVQPAVDPLPSQTGNAGKFLTTNGTNASWAERVPQKIDSSSRYMYFGEIGYTPNLDVVSIGYQSGNVFEIASQSVCIGNDARARGQYTTSVGSSATCGMNAANSVAIGYHAETGSNSIYSIAIGTYAEVSYLAKGAIQLGKGTNSTSGTLAVGLSTNGTTWNNYELLSADGTIPEARLADTTNATAGQVLTLDSNLNAVWQAGGGGGSSYTAGTGIDITNGSISVTAPTVVNAASNNVQLNICPAGGTPNTTDRGGESIVIGSNIKGGSLNDSGSIRIGNNINTGGAQYGAYGIYIASNGIDKTGGSLIVNASVEATTNNSGRTGGILIGGGYKPVIIGSKSGVANGGAYSIAIGGCSDDNAQLNSDYSVLLNTGNNSAANITEHNTFWWGNNNGMYKLFDADGTVPTARLTKVNTTITLTAAGWSNGSQTVSVSGITSTGVVFVSPDPTDQADYTDAGILCTAQAAGTLTFTCDSVPSGDIDVNVVML